MSRDGDAAQREVRRHRAATLGGHGPGAPEAELAVHQRDRALLGSLPSAAERALVAVQTAAARGEDPDELVRTVSRIRETLS